MTTAPPSGSSAAILREILATPAYREIIRLYTDDAGAPPPGATLRALLDDDPELPLRVAGASPAAINDAIHAALALGRQLSAHPEPLLEGYLRRIADDVDTEALAELPRAWGPVLSRAAPWLAGAATDAVQDADFGKLRRTVEELSHGGRGLAEQIVTHVLADPVKLANTLVAVPPVLNDVTGTAATALDAVDLPDELLASAVLSVLEDIDAEDIGRIATGLARAIDSIHRGSALLGDTEPAFRAVAADLIDDLLRTLDGEAARNAAVALGEDGETLAGVVADLLRHRPELLGAWIGAALAVQAPLLRGAAQLAREASALPDEALADAGRQIREDLDAEAAVVLARELLVLARRYAEANPDGAVLRDLAEAAERERLGRAGADLARTLYEQAMDNPSIKQSVEPESIGKFLNKSLARLRQTLERDPDALSDYLRRLFAAVDAGELERTWEALVRSAARAMEANAPAVAAVVRPVVREGWSTVARRLDGRRPRLLRRGASERRFPWSA